MSDRMLLIAIVEALEEQGLARKEYQLQRLIDVEAIKQLVNSTRSHTELG